MAVEITVPRLGWSMEEGVFGEWLKTPGEFVRVGEMVFLLEGEKAAHEIESFDSGYLCVPEGAPRPGETVKVGQVIGFLLAEGEVPPASIAKPSAGGPQVGAPASASTTLPGTPAAAPPRTETESSRPAGSPPRAAGPAARRRARQLGIDLQLVATLAPSGRVLSEDVEHAAGRRQPVSVRRGSGPIATPRARRRAQELGIDWTRLRGTGRNGRIRERDVVTQEAPRTENAATVHDLVPTTAGKHTPASKLRAAIARRMHAGVTVAAPVTLTRKVDAGPLVTWRAKRKSHATDAAVPGYHDLVVWLAARTLRDLPQLNACWYRDGIYRYDSVHIAIAVDTDSGLLAPVIRDADQLDIEQIATRTRQLIASARAGRLSQQDLAGGTFTVSNLGMFGVDAFTPILNLPQAGVLGVGRIVEEPVVRSGQIEVGHTITFSLTFDHRAVDGAPAARWLQRLCDRVASLDVDGESI